MWPKAPGFGELPHAGVRVFVMRDANTALAYIIALARVVEHSCTACHIVASARSALGLSLIV